MGANARTSAVVLQELLVTRKLVAVPRNVLQDERATVALRHAQTTLLARTVR